ncbi:MAG: leucine-rich repeat domain-containing protein [Ruminococcaceae bacterium]|nr:leucine-rich repeat domain-containing protein [Oscillospiraceae bacterium]
MKKLIVILSCLFCLVLLTSCQGNETDQTNNTQKNDTEHTHIYTSTVIAPSCTEDGYTLHICSLCNEQYSDQTVKALGHDYKEDSIQDTHCDQHQKKIFKCSVCQDTYYEELEAKGTIHTYISTVTYPDRENKGYTTHKCKNCDNSYIDSYTDPVDFSVGLKYTKQSGGYYVSGIGTCKETDITIPPISEQGYRIVGIAKQAFANANVKTITVLDGVNDIQEGAFSYCAALEEVTMSKNAKPAENIFKGNPALTKLTMPMPKPIAYYFDWYMSTPEGYKELEQGDGSVSGTYYGTVPLSLREIKIFNSPCRSAFSNCDMLTKISIAENATSIGAGAFRNCTGLTEFLIPDTVTSIGCSAFCNTSITSITIPKSVRFSVSDQRMFENCSKLSEVTILSQSTVMPSSMFLGCVSLTELQIPDVVTNLGSSFISGTNVESFTIPSGVTEIAMHTFNGCTKIKKIIIPEGVKVIGYGAFKGCTGLEEIEIPASVQEIGHEAFMNCTSLKKAVLPPTLNLTRLDESIFKNCTSLEKVEMPTNINIIPDEMFFGCSSLREINIPNTVTAIYNSAFEESGLVSVTIPASVTGIGSRIFANCTSLISVVFESDNAPLGNDMFSGATALGSIRIPKNVIEIPIGFCKNATSLKTIEFNKGLKFIRDEAFSGCTSIESITFPTTLTAINAMVFKGCTSLQSVDFSGITFSEERSKTGKEWFADCTSLTEVKNYENIAYINASMFKNTPIQTVENGMTVALGWLLKVNPEELARVVVVPQGVTKIYDYVFSACNNIDEVILPEGLIFLGTRIFGETDGSTLIKVTFPESLSSIDTGTVCFLPNLEEVVIGKGNLEIEKNFFKKLKTVRFRGTIEEFKQMLWYTETDLQHLTVVCANGTIEPTPA